MLTVSHFSEISYFIFIGYLKTGAGGAGRVCERAPEEPLNNPLWIRHWHALGLPAAHVLSL